MVRCVFLAVMRAGSTLAASKTLGMSQPTVARRIDALEHVFGLTLFDRETTGFCPTDAARQLMPKAEAVENAVGELGGLVEDISRPRSIRITAYSKNFSSETTALFSEFNETRPDVPLMFIQSIHPLDLIAGEADVALRISFSDPDPALIKRKLSTPKFTIYASRKYADAYGLPDSPDTLAGHRVVMFQRHDVVPLFRTWLEAHTTPDQIVACYSEPDLVDAAILAGKGIGIMNVRLATMDYPDLIPCFEAPKELTGDYSIYVSPEAWRRPEVKEFVRFFAPRYSASLKRTS